MNFSKIKIRFFLGNALSITIVLLGLVPTVHAALFSRLGGQAVYDDDLDVTWISDADLSSSNTFGAYLEGDPVGGNPGTTWQSSQDWIAAMNASDYLNLSDWRLPICDSTDCTNSEIEHLFTSEGITKNAPGLFSNIRNYYWTGTEVASDPDNYAWVQSFLGSPFDYFKTNTGQFPWAVRWGDVPSKACSITLDLPSNQWRQISLPCDPRNNNKVSDVFANIPGTYGTSWMVYRYDSQSNSYQDVGVAGTLDYNQGYWIIQVSGNVVTLSMPQGSTTPPTKDCVSSPRGCIEIPISLPANWNMIGYPHPTQGVFEKLSIVTDDTYYPGYGTSYIPSPCHKNHPYRDGCSPSEASGYDISTGSLWTYDGSKYVEVKSSTDLLKPWTGYWLGILPRAGEFAAKGVVTPRVKVSN